MRKVVRAVGARAGHVFFILAFCLGMIAGEIFIKNGEREMEEKETFEQEFIRIKRTLREKFAILSGAAGAAWNIFSDNFTNVLESGSQIVLAKLPAFREFIKPEVLTTVGQVLLAASTAAVVIKLWRGKQIAAPASMPAADDQKGGTNG